MIGRLSNVIHTPDNPSHSDSVWHIERIESEYVVATKVCYSVSSNITRFTLQLRIIIRKLNEKQNHDRDVGIV